MRRKRNQILDVDVEHAQDDIKLPALDAETMRLLRYASHLHWEDEAYLLGVLHWHCEERAMRIDDNGDRPGAAAAARRADDVLQLWRAWMDRYRDLRAKRITRQYESDELALGTRLRERLDFLSAELGTLAEDLTHTTALLADEQSVARDRVAAMQAAVSDLSAWIEQHEARINAEDTKADIQ